MYSPSVLGLLGARRGERGRLILDPESSRSSDSDKKRLFDAQISRDTLGLLSSNHKVWRSVVLVQVTNSYLRII